MSKILEKALMAACLTRPYFGAALAALHPVPRPGLGTVAVDRFWRLYYDEAWLASLGHKVAGNVLIHEVNHLLRRHYMRKGDRDPKLFNLACDAEINDDIDVKLPDGAIMPKLFGADEHQTAEQYYDIIANKSPAVCDGVCGGGSGAGNPLEQELPFDATAIDNIKQDEIRRQVARAIKSHRGTVPESDKLWADVEIKPQPVNWRSILRATLSSVAREFQRGRQDYTYSRLSRRWRPGNPIKPASVEPVPKIGVIADTSGSMSGLGSDVSSTVHNIVRAVGKVTLVSCDTDVKDKKQVNSSRIKFAGGGGTDMRPAFAALENVGIIVVITDCETPWPVLAPSASTIVVRLGEYGQLPDWTHKVVKVTDDF